MKTFEYTGYLESGRPERGWIDAWTVKEAREHLLRRGVFADRVSPVAAGKRVKRAARAGLYHELGTLLDSGMALADALAVLAETPDRQAVRHTLLLVLSRVREGSSFASAMSAPSGDMGDDEVAVIEAAETSGALPQMLVQLAGFMEEQQRLRDRVRSALTYPTVVFVVGLMVVALMLGVLVPRVEGMLEATGIAPPWITRVTIALGRWMARWGGLCIAATGLLVWGLIRQLRSDMSLRSRFDHWLFGLPMTGRAYRLLVQLRFARTLAMLIRGGVPVVDGFELAGRATGSLWVSKLATEQAEAVRHGERLSTAIACIPELASHLQGIIRIGESSGRLDRLLDNSARRLEHEWERYTGQLVGILEPALIFAVGGFVLAITLSVLMPLMSLSRGIAG